MRLYHYTMWLRMTSIFRHRTLWPSPSLRLSGLSRAEVGRDPDRFGFQTGVSHGRRYFDSETLLVPGHSGWRGAAFWLEGQVFDVALTRADWCYSVMSYFP